MMSLQQNELEHKQADSLRGDKDDYKRQSAELRKTHGILGGSTLAQPQLSADPLAPRTTVPLEPTVQAPRKIEHDGMKASISSSPIAPSSGPALMEQVGEQTGAGIEAAKEKLQPLIAPVVAKATSLYDQWKADDSTSSSGPTIKERASVAGAAIQERATVAASQAQTLYNDKLAPAMTDAANKAGPMLSNAAAQAKPMLAQASAQAQVAAAQARPVIENAIEQAKPILASAAATAQKIYAEQVQPALASGLSAAQEQISHMREDGLQVTMEKAGTAYQRRVASAKTAINETYEAKVPLEQRKQIAAAQKGAVKQMRYGWNRALDMWETQARPMLREYSAKGWAFIRARNLQAPLGIASAVLLLLLGWSILHSMSASRASHEQVVVYQPDWRPSTGPVQGAEMPGLMDKAKMHIHAADAKITDGIDTIKARTADLAQHAEDSINMNIDSLKLKAQELKDSIPSTADLQAHLPGSKPAPITDDSVLGSIKSGAADLKARVNSAIHPAEPSTMDQIKSGAADLKARVNSAIHPAEPSTLDNLKASAASTLELNKLRAENAKLRAEAQLHSARASIPSAADLKAKINSAIHPAEPSTMDQIKSGAADLKARVNSAIHPAEPSTMDQIKAGAADLKEQIQSGAADLKARAEDALELTKLRAENAKLRAQAQIHSARANIPSSADIKERAESTIDSARANMPSSTQQQGKVSELRLKINDRLEHMAHLLPEQLTALKQRLGSVYERLTPAQRHYAHAHPEILDPENHAVSIVDEHGNPKSILDVDLE